ncbi:hypothetical protein ERX46_00400 [Brumimicrobium glaciale]|uniref:Uncharacterized protein n=1 Tax=Brumimicrobium glaciale TaxID=200475 RepID=A0A4Q4KR16_9FLAO|nr:hypothetical protein [Brumimicrobium glaciale]RYM35485.1 hypothetical protein ERX46_00400 [Brumimicrobium glaciale]
MKLLLYSVSLFLSAIFFANLIYFIDLSTKGADAETAIMRSAVGMVICLLIVFLMKKMKLTGK